MKLDEYDLISGKVKRLEYQKNQADQWIHQFEYDILNRLKKVGTSRDNWYYEQDANYWYYLHRPLMRTEIGQRQVQGLDNVYSINGWHKALNSDICDSTKDAGKDAYLPNHQYVARDILSYQINYFKNDYKSINLFATNNFSNFTSLYNGNIAATIISQDTMPTAFRKYQYDALNRLRGVDWWLGNVGNFFSVSSFRERLSYDRDGNIVRLDRWAKGGVMDSLVYRYYSGNNRLKQVEDMVAASVYNNDVDNQTDTMNYIYDKAGNLVEDKSEQLKMRWTYYGKLKQIDSAGVPKLRFYYDAMGNRVVKENVMSGTKEIYIRDAQGNVIAVYEVSKKNNVDSLFSKEFYIYGSSRLGYLMDRKYIARKTYGKTLGGSVGLPSVPHITFPNPFILPGTTSITPIYFGNKRYELSDWLGNVRVVINDKKTPVNTGTTTVSYLPQVMSVSDYYSFGSQISERSYDPVKPMYRFGFNGKDQQNELYGVGDAYDFGARIYNALIGKFMSIDPDFKKYPQFSPYSFSINNPIRYVDIMGLGPGDRIKAARKMIGIKYKQETNKEMRTGISEKAMEYMDCAEFVCRVLKADHITENVLWLNTVGLYKFLSNEQDFIHSMIPQPGDIALWEGHVGIVSDVDPKTGKFKLIHARGTGKLSAENKWYATVEQYRISHFYGFYRPKKETPDGKLDEDLKNDPFNDKKINSQQSTNNSVSKVRNLIKLVTLPFQIVNELRKSFENHLSKPRIDTNSDKNK